jgi:hypothetical protein
MKFKALPELVPPCAAQSLMDMLYAIAPAVSEACIVYVADHEVGPPVRLPPVIECPAICTDGELPVLVVVNARVTTSPGFTQVRPVVVLVRLTPEMVGVVGINVSALAELEPVWFAQSVIDMLYEIAPAVSVPCIVYTAFQVVGPPVKLPPVTA